jgi:hypothetical protein
MPIIKIYQKTGLAVFKVGALKEQEGRKEHE